MEGSFVNKFISCPDINNYGNFRPLSTTVFFCAKVALETRLGIHQYSILRTAVDDHVKPIDMFGDRIMLQYAGTSHCGLCWALL